MSVEKLTLKGFVDEVKDVSEGPHSRRFCFVLGAGASKTSGIKSGQELVNIWDKELLERNPDEHIKWKQEKGIDENNKDSFYSEFYERRFGREPLDGYNYLEKLMERTKPSIGYVILSYLLSETRHNVVITTNFDHLAEDAVNYYAQTIPLIIGHESLAHYVSKRINRPTIIKIHRDLLFDPKNRTDELNTFHANWEKALETILTEYHPVFIGYAGNDNSLMDFLIENADKFVKREWAFPYWMIYKTEKMSEKVLEFLEKTSGYLIQHEGFDEVLCLLGEAFNYKLPTREVFLSDAEKRFQELSNSIDEFTEKMEEKKESNQYEHSLIAKKDNVEESGIGQAIQQITNETELQRMYWNAVMFTNIGRHEEARKIKEELVQREPQNARYHNSLGTTLQKLGRYEDALAEMKKAIELEPENAKYHSAIGDVFGDMGLYEDALISYGKATELEPDNPEYHSDFGYILNYLEMYEEALLENREAVEMEPENAWYRGILGDTWYGLGCYDEAIREKQKAIELEPEDGWYYDRLGDTFYNLERYEDALVENRKAVELEPENAWFRNHLGETLMELEMYEEAFLEFKKAIELEPDDGWNHSGLGSALFELGKGEAAIDEFQKAIELEPENVWFHEQLMDAFRGLERYEEAEEEGKIVNELRRRNGR